eukprot:CAMPEP_0183366902 /NCGR_PEP_ID=MMETSP0164_2-20130417/90531_1 /TAXON_ID=221442 /ORGANISM="Coccolithus pelagicus ssp braarudi, Strain PLY182g" /LENGTH=31 /DNA_ID= /DNA_START= /DNA_END= /DNA_ORIENTATION=
MAACKLRRSRVSVAAWSTRLAQGNVAHSSSL